MRILISRNPHVQSTAHADACLLSHRTAANTARNTTADPLLVDSHYGLAASPRAMKGVETAASSADRQGDPGRERPQRNGATDRHWRRE